ncbi:hypothetical protein BDN72DRAFT_525410 [Pluteus cervinus]|uniref:Uncharacterized protein n=1 Tax=Pluteus cervinus TaxID=181527 RepID=A0ACD3AY29_9AGAR|nr:hypothetical protein BDN72DRAFT_525410 [Pluteus cervinus]
MNFDFLGPQESPVPFTSSLLLHHYDRLSFLLRSNLVSSRNEGERVVNASKFGQHYYNIDPVPYIRLVAIFQVALCFGGGRARSLAKGPRGIGSCSCYARLSSRARETTGGFAILLLFPVQDRATLAAGKTVGGNFIDIPIVCETGSGMTNPRVGANGSTAFYSCLPGPTRNWTVSR